MIPIENNRLVKLIDEAKALYPSDQLWVAEEKIDGCNFQFEVDVNGVRIHSRTKADADMTNNLGIPSHLFPGYRALALSIKKKLDEWYGVADVTRIYCESYGGYYGGGTIVRLKPQVCRVLYSPKREISIYTIQHKSASFDKWLTPKEMGQISKDEDWPFAKPLQIGTLDELVQLPIVYQTTIPDIHGLPKPLNASLNPENNAEGYVIKPWDAPTHIISDDHTRKYYTYFKRVRIEFVNMSAKTYCKFLTVISPKQLQIYDEFCAVVKDLCKSMKWENETQEERVAIVIDSARSKLASYAKDLNILIAQFDELTQYVKSEVSE